MREFVKSFLSLGVALSLFPLKQVENVLKASDRDERKTPATKAMDSISNATLDQFGGTLRSAFSAIDNVQRGLVELTCAVLWPPAVTTWGSGSGTQPDNSSSPTGRVNRDSYENRRHESSQRPGRSTGTSRERRPAGEALLTGRRS